MKNFERMRRILCVALACCMLLLTACSDGDAQGQGGDGRYVEIDITPPVDGPFMSFLAPDGAIVCYDTGLMNRYESGDGGESWSRSSGPGEGDERLLSAGTVTMLSDGRLLAYIQDEGFLAVSPDGAVASFAVDRIDSEADGVVISMLQAVGDNRLLVSYMTGVTQFVDRRPVGGGPGGPGGPVGPAGSAGQGGSGGGSGGGTGGRTGYYSGSESVTVTSGGDGAATSGGDGAATSGSGGDGDEPGGGSGNGSGGRTERAFSANAISMKTLLVDALTGEAVADLPGENITAAAAEGDSLYLMDMDGAVTLFSLADGSALSGNGIRFGSAEVAGPLAPGGARRFRGLGGGGMFGGGGGSAILPRRDGCLYAIYDSDLLMADADGYIDTVLESTAYSIGSPSGSVASMFVLDGGEFIVNMNYFDNNRLYKYVWDENAAVNPDKTISVWSLNDNNFVRAAITELRKANPDALISYEVALGDDSAISVSDAVKNLNTRLLGGSGPDVMILDDCPAGSYAANGMFLELSGLLSMDDVYPNLLTPFMSGGELFYLPMQLYIPALMGETAALSKARTLDALVELVVSGNEPALFDPSQTRRGPLAEIAVEDRSELYFDDLKELSDVLWLSCAPAVVPEGRLDTDALRRYIEAVKAISDKYDLTNSDSGMGQMRMVAAFAGRGGGSVNVLTSSLIRYTSQMTNYGAFNAGNLQILNMMMNRVGSDVAPLPGLATGAWQPSAIVAISADTEVPGFAASLLQTMLSPDVQQINYGSGLPVTRTGIALQIENINEMHEEFGGEPFTFDMDGLIDGLQSPSLVDTVLADMMWESIEACCKGEIDVEGAVSRIEQSVKNYLAERA